MNSSLFRLDKKSNHQALQFVYRYFLEVFLKTVFGTTGSSGTELSSESELEQAVKKQSKISAGA